MYVITCKYLDSNPLRNINEVVLYLYVWLEPLGLCQLPSVIYQLCPYLEWCSQGHNLEMLNNAWKIIHTQTHVHNLYIYIT